jgi:ribonuclease P protein component
MKKKLVFKGRFERLMKNSQVIKQGGVTIFITTGRGRIGVAVHKSVKGAVNRNAIKRHLREYARLVILPQLGKRDCIIVSNSKSFSKRPVTL